MKRAALAIPVLALALTAAVALAAQPAETRLPRPPFPGPAGDPGKGELELAIVSSQPNEITDVEAWIARNRLDLRDAPLAKLPQSYAGLRLVKAIRQARTVLAVYGPDFASGRVLVALDASGRVRYALDFATYAYAPVTAPGDREFVYQQVVWAAEAGGTLYVETAHSTYARSSGSLNGYLTALDLATRKVKWRSPALVANAGTFELYGGVIVTGYGFTAEPDYLWLLDRRTGKPVARAVTPSAPELIVRKGSLLYVRTYDHDLVVKLVRTP